MGVAVLHPQDCIKEPFSHETLIISPSMKRPSRNPNPNSNPNRVQSHRRKRSPSGTGGGGAIHNRSPPRKTVVAKSPVPNLVMGKVKILRRGEDLNLTTSDRAPEIVKVEKIEDQVDLVLSSTDRLGPDPDMVPKQIRLTELNPVAGFYAGSAFIASPPPSSLPLPGFFTKNIVLSKTDDDATSDLRRMLRLDVS
ncbi:hypothetical protein L1049_013042 [Liquidambar formosana]|uniref:Uncharacterized protein n=1 Tax=Liquidambar formosana TaxID=63359 RepID=A0AAP0RL06_LIQFO